MTHQTLRRMAGMMVVLALAASSYAQGVYWESVTQGSPAGNGMAKMYYMPGMFKHEQDAGQAIIVRLDKEVMYEVDPAQKTYSEITFAEMEKAMNKANAKMDAKMAELQKSLAQMPPEQRKMVEGMMPSKGKESAFEVKKTGDKKTISGYPCTKYDIMSNGSEFMAVWASNAVKEFEPMKKDFEKYAQRMSLMNAKFGKGLFEAMKQVDGFPVETDMSGITNVVTKIEKKVVPVSEFEPPAGYKKVKSKFLEEAESME